ncbi:hypothetical protein ANANG_G00001810 [Anguilla anguilla]|uniref:Doublecortin domain-containing protein n=1 Tax=Anguilla anguilla TaxID=7936 RepID=A0A9D3MZF4_ANGAN|nr:hypothetical protein ANANG_G00001810 [Anguilla anguilla]
MQTGPPGSSLNETPPRYDTPPAPLKCTPHVTSSSPAKRITFFKSGDAQFGGVRMAIHRRSFKCFDALLDDLSRKVPLPFGVRTITTPRGTHRIRQLDQLQDGGCYLCSDRHCAKPIDIEAAGKGPAIWHHSRPPSGRRKPSRPEEAPARPASRYPRHPKRIVLVKNTDPAVRRSIIVSRHSTRTLRTFMEEVSELMNCHIRKLYTLDGHKIDSAQGLMQCPSVLVCVGQEPFRPLLVESFRKNSDEKLPGLRNRSQSSTFSEGQESKKNVNFGLETKKSIIHPRSDSSNRSTRFSLSSEKSYPNGLNASPGNSGCAGTCPHTKGSLTNDDIEKRVIVNKDGSLSVHMSVRFRLLNDETLQWSTEIKKSAVGTECCLGKEEEPSGLQQGKTQGFSEPESISGCEVEDTYTTKLEQMLLEESRCQNCCNHCQEYDIWKHPLHSDPDPTRPARSSSSSTSSCKIVCKKASVASMHTVSCSSEEYTEHVVEKATCIQQTAEDRDTRVEFCSVSRCCSHSEICTASPGPRGDQKNNTKCDQARPDSSSSICSHKEQISVKVNGVIEDRPTSAISNSSKVLEALREDQDDDENDEEEDLPLSAFRASVRSCMQLAANNQKLQSAGTPEENPEVSAIGTKLNCSTSSASPIIHLTPRPPSRESNCSAHSSHPRKSNKAASPEPDSLPNEAEQEDDNEKRKKSGASSRQTSKCHGGASSETEGAQGDCKRAFSSRASRASKTSEHSCYMRVSPTGLEGTGQSATGETEERSISNTSTGTQTSKVVNEWLKKIPSDNSIYEVGDNFEECCEGREAVEGQKESEDLTNDVTGGDQAFEEGKEQQIKAEAPEKIKDEICAPEAAELEHPDTTDMAQSPESKCLIRDSFTKGCHSSVQVMKVLLSSKLDRCNSLPEVSPVYGRKISSSAKGLLDCLTKLQLVGSDPADVKAKSDKYQEVMDILQSLWLSDPLDCNQTRQKSQLKDHSPDDECNPRSSSGVDVSGSSGESGKSMGTVDQVLKVGIAQGRITPVLEQDAPQEPIAFSDGEENSQQALENASDPATPDIASRVQGTPGGGETDTEKEQQDEEEGLASEQTIRSSESPKDVIETPSSSNKSSGNDSNPEKSPDEKDPKDTSSGTSTSVQRAQVTEKTTQDPDPVWVLNLLQKLEKQFMSHYMTAMAEFKVRWDLDESVLLDTMINELKDEVHMRIQSSISWELKKIQSRAARGPRSSLQAITRESTQQTEQRRQRLRVMRNKSIYSSLSRSEENFTATATDYSDQRSEDDFCPCDTCMKKKMAARSIPPEFVNPPPQMKDFDLRKILQKKQEPSQQKQTGQQEALAGNNEEAENLKLVPEKSEEENDDEEHYCTVKKSSREEGLAQEGEGEKKGVVEQEEETADDETEEGEEGRVEVGGAEEGGDEAEDIEEAAEEKEDKERETDADETRADEGQAQKRLKRKGKQGVETGWRQTGRVLGLNL